MGRRDAVRTSVKTRPVREKLRLDSPDKSSGRPEKEGPTRERIGVFLTDRALVGRGGGRGSEKGGGSIVVGEVWKCSRSRIPNRPN